MNTPLENGLGHIYGPGKTVETAGAQPVWLEQVGSRVFGGVINLQRKIDGTNKVIDFYPESIKTATMCYWDATNKEYVPIPTFRVLAAVSATDTTVKIANWPGLAKLVDGMSLASAADTTKKITLDMDDVTIDANGNYELSITAADFGVLAEGDALILEAAASQVPAGLTKSNLLYKGADATSLLNITLVDAGRLIEPAAAPVPKAWKKDYFQTIKFEEA